MDSSEDAEDDADDTEMEDYEADDYRLSKEPLAPGSKPAQSREAKALADDSSMFPLSDPE